jgi:hypothetical protein
MLGRDRTRTSAGFHGCGREERGDEHEDVQHGAAYLARGLEATRAASQRENLASEPTCARVPRSMARRLTLTLAGEAYEEKDFYLEDLRGKSVLIAIEPEAAAQRPDLSHLAATVGDLVRNGTRVVLWWPTLGPARGTPARGRARSCRRAETSARHRPCAPRDHPRVRPRATPAPTGMRANLWEALRSEGLSLIVSGPAGLPPFPEAPVALAIALRIPKLVLLDRHGGLLGPEPTRLSFVDENVLETLLRRGEAEWSGLGERRGLLVAVHGALEGGVEAVNLCAPEAIAEELFTYEGSGTLFTAGDYCQRRSA